jgi:GT2 family glycosyltransferase
LSVFVETGTFKGDTVESLSKYFDKLITIEFSEQLWSVATARFKDVGNIETHLGNSPEVLAKLRPALMNLSSLFWLDAHWCVAENTAGNQSQCPLLDEIRAINKLSDSSVLLIDDARLFLAPPPAPHDVSQWPSFEEIIAALRRLSDQHELMIVNDTIIFYPKEIKNSVAMYARTCGVDWLSVAPYLDPKNDLLQSLEEKEKIIQLQHALLQRQLVELEGKKVVRAVTFIFGYMLRPFLRLTRPVYDELKPRLGNLHQHPPHELYLSACSDEISVLVVTPKISIVTPSFNQGDFIERTIASVLDQEYPNLEFRVQDGGSSDCTLEVLKRYADSFFERESRPDNGQSHAINLGFSKTSGEIMGWLNSDDILLPGTLAYVARYFNLHPEVDVVYGHRIILDENDQQIGRWMMPSHDDEVLSWADFIPQETMFWRRSIWDKVGGRVDESFQFAMDWDLLVRFRAAGAHIVRLPRFLGGFRVHPHQKTSAEIADSGIQEMNRIRRRILGRVPSKREIQRALFPYLLRHIATDWGWRIQNRLRLG